MVKIIKNHFFGEFLSLGLIPKGNQIEKIIVARL